MRKDKVQPDAVVYNYVISALSKGGQWDAALRLLQEAEEFLFDGQKELPQVVGGGCGFQGGGCCNTNLMV